MFNVFIPVRKRSDTAAEIDPGRTAWTGSCRFGHEHDVIAQVVKALDQPGGGALTRDLVEVALAEVTEGLTGGQHVERGDEQLVSDGHQRPYRAAASAQAVVLVTVVAALGPHRC